MQIKQKFHTQINRLHKTHLRKISMEEQKKEKLSNSQSRAIRNKDEQDFNFSTFLRYIKVIENASNIEITMAIYEKDELENALKTIEDHGNTTVLEALEKIKSKLL